MHGKIRWGIVGPGKIAHKFAKDVKITSDGVLSAVASRSVDRAQEFANEHKIPNVFGSYEAMFQSPEVDVVYIATPHNFHKQLALMAMQHGKHVLCEKPLGVNSEEVKELIRAAKDHNVFLMEGLWSRFNPSMRKVKELVDQGKIGQVSYIRADFAFYALDRDESSRLFNPELASGSILDIGIYPIFLSYLILGKPSAIKAFANFHPNGTEIQTSILFKYPNALSVLYSGLTSTSKMEAEISGSEAELLLHPRWHETNSFSFKKQEELKTIELPMKGGGLYHEIEEVHNCLKTNKLESELWSHEDSLVLAELIDEVRRQVGVTFPFEA
ncbi:Gfo/Idh/MocA family protein [Flagellimonas allohymeniacidonis]|uniref:Gfo/Idh/MocA family oxidoreductase n=1 Tax=Flagellimonas allohymeniacidonis TaxID=2517819 RepID=A0A4Q8QK90_9FLAO|nr:Gfo/Idh/MocA family oxidoreductase [Allomuricauda hymeniacidonis]TAI48656.1 Gfo/Idh/MocA family oxidoreductase [Allomuricauda hymeniacidonis]